MTPLFTLSHGVAWLLPEFVPAPQPSTQEPILRKGTVLEGTSRPEGHRAEADARL